MFKSKDLYKKNVYDNNGKMLGRVKDMIIDFINGKVKELSVENSSSAGKMYYVNIDEAGTVIKGNATEKCDGVLFSKLTNMQVIDRNGKEKGSIEDLIVDEKNLNIKALVLNSGEIESLIKGNEVLLMKNVMMEDDCLYYFGENNITFKNIPDEINNITQGERA